MFLFAFAVLGTQAATVATVDGTGYETLEAAIAAAEPVDGVVTYEICGKAEVSATGWIQVLKSGLSNVKKVAFVGRTEDAEICIAGDLAILADQRYDIDVSFKNLKLSKLNPKYGGDYGHSTNYFTTWLRNTGAAENTVTYENCTFPNGACNNQYGKTVYKNCTFANGTTGLFNLWIYGGSVEMNGGEFTGTRGMKVYTEGTPATAPSVEVKGTAFSGLTEKAAIVVSKAATVEFAEISVADCPKGLFQKDIEGSSDDQKVTVTANGSKISGSFEITANKEPETAKTEFNITGGMFTAEVPSDYCADGFTVKATTDADGNTVYGVVEAAFVTVTGIAGFADRKFASFAEAYAEIKPAIQKLGLVQESATADVFDALFTSVDANGNATLTYTISGTVVYDETGCANLLTMGRKASHYGNGRHLINFKFVGATGKDTDTLTVNSNITLPYEWWGEKTTTGIHFENLTITGSAPSGLYPSQPFFEGIDFSVSKCALKGIKIYNCSNVEGSYTITDSVLDGTGAPADSYAIHLQGNETAPLSINIKGNTISGYDRGINIDQKTAVATIEGNTISVTDTGRSCIQLSSLATADIVGNTLELTGGNAITLHENLLTLSAAPEVSISGNKVTGTGYLIYDDAKANDKEFTSDNLKLTYATDNTVAETVDTTKGVKGSTAYITSTAVNNEVQHYVAQVGTAGYTTLAAAFAALSAENHTLTLLKDAAWDAATPVYWAAGTQSGYAATLTAALTAAYKANEGAITIVCRPGADVGEMTHGHVADDLTIYGNDAFISGGECDLEVDTYTFSRATGKQATDGVCLDKDITITAYELDNLGVWGERHTANKVTVNLTDCDGKALEGKTNLQRVYISGTTGVNDITLTDCDFLTKATAVYSNADGAIKAVNCSFTGGQVPFNINHKANGTQTVAVENCTFTNCGDADGWKQFAAPLRLVNSGTGTQSAEVTGCAFADTVGANGDILLGDGRTGQASNDVELKVVNTVANIQAQKPGYYGGETVDAAKKATATSLASGTLETSVAKLLPVNDGSEAHPYSREQFAAMTRAEYIAAQERLGGTLYVNVGDYAYEKDGVLGNGVRNDTPGQVPDHAKLNAYGENGYLGEKNDGANGHTVVFVGGTITSGVTGYTSIDNIGTSLLLAVPAYTKVTFEKTTFKNVLSFNYQLYTSPWSQLGGLTFNGCTFDGIIVGAIAAQELAFNGCTFNNYVNTASANNSNPTWIRPAYGNWTKGDNEGQGTDFRSLTNITFADNKVTSTRPVKFERIAQWEMATTVTATNNTFAITPQEGDKEEKKTKNVGLYFGANAKFDLVVDKNEKSGETAALYTAVYSAPNGTDYDGLPAGSTVKNAAGDDVTIDDARVWKKTDTLTLKTTVEVASVTNAKGVSVAFATLADALAAAKDGETVTLLADVNGDGIVVPANAFPTGLVVDFAGHTYTVGGLLVGSSTTKSNGFQLLAGNKITFKNGSLVGAPATAGEGTEWTGAPAILIQNYCDLTLEQMTVKGGDETCYTLSNNNGDIVIADSTIVAGKGTRQGPFAFDVCRYASYPSVHVTVKGASVIEGNVEISGTIGDNQSRQLDIEGGTFKGAFKVVDQPANIAISGGTFATAIDETYCAAGFIPTKNADGTYGVKEGAYVAQVGDTKYATLAEALSEANSEGALCELIADVTLKGTWTSILNFKGTFDGKDHKITGLNVSGSEYVGLIGVLDGGTVKNVQFASVDVSGGTDAGSAVGRIVNDGTVDNVKVLSGTVKGTKRIGGVVGSIKACGTVKNCENAAKVEASTYNVGGIVGAAYYTETSKEMYITNCRNTADITSAGVGAGGIVGLSCANVSGNTNTGAVKGKEVGGIVGEQKTYGSVTDNTNSGAVTNTGTDTDNWGTGGIIGWLRYHGTGENYAYEKSAIITVSGNINNGTITGGNDAGGIVGVVYNSAVITDNSNTAATLSGTTFAAGIVGNYQITETPAAGEPAKNKLTFTRNTSTTALDNITANNKDLLIYDNREKVAQIGDKKYATLEDAVEAAKIGDTIKVIANDVSLSAPEGWTISESTLIPVDKTWHIANLDQLKEFQSAVNGGNTFDGQTVVLDADIDMVSVENWTPIGNAPEKKFAGTFDGQNHTISGLKITGGSYVGLFGYLGAATVQNVALVGANVSGVKRVGALVGQIAGNATIKNCSLDATSSVAGSDSNTGGLIGEASGSIVVTLENLTNNAPVTNTESGTSRAAGILCQATSGASVTLKNCVNKGTITTNGGYAGGIVSAKQGGASLVFDGCSNTGTLANGTKGTGALLAWSCNGSSVTISNYSGDVANAIGWLSQDNYDHVFVINGVEHYIRVAKGGSGYTFASRYEAAQLMNKSYLQEIIGFFNYAKTVNHNFEGYPATPVEVLKSAYSTSDESIKGSLFNTDVSSGWPQLLSAYNVKSGKSLTADDFAVTWGTRDVLFMVSDPVMVVVTDTASAQAALDAATPNTTIIFKSGTYEPLFIRQTLEKSMRRSDLDKDGSYPAYLRSFKNLTLIAEVGAEVVSKGITAEAGLFWHASAPASNQAEMRPMGGFISYLALENVTIDGIAFDSTEQSAVTLRDNGAVPTRGNIMVDGLTIQNCTGRGVASNENIHFLAAGAGTNDQNFPGTEKKSFNNIVVKNCELDSYYQPIAFNNATAVLNGLTVTGNTFSNNGNSNVLQLSNKVNSGAFVIENNLFKDLNGRVVRATNSTANWTITGNRLDKPIMYDDSGDLDLVKISVKAETVGAAVTESENDWNTGTLANGTYIANGDPALLPVARIGENKYYHSLQAAFDAAKDGETVKLLADVTESVTIDADRTLTLDLNGKTLSAGKASEALTVTGHLTIDDTSAAKSGRVVGDGRYAVYMKNRTAHVGEAAVGGSLTLNAGSLEGATHGVYILANQAAFTMNGGKVSATKEESIRVNNDYHAKTISLLGGEVGNVFLGSISSTELTTLTVGKADQTDPAAVKVGKIGLQYNRGLFRLELYNGLVGELPEIGSCTATYTALGMLVKSDANCPSGKVFEAIDYNGETWYRIAALQKIAITFDDSKTAALPFATDWLKAHVGEGEASWTTEALEEKAANELAKWQCYLFGLDPNKKEAKVVATAGQGTDEAIPLAVANADASASPLVTGGYVTVAYVLMGSNDGTVWTQVATSNKRDGLEIPLTGTTYKFYRVDVTVTSAEGN